MSVKEGSYSKWVRWLHTEAWDCQMCGKRITGYKTNPGKSDYPYCPQCGSRMNAYHKRHNTVSAKWCGNATDCIWTCSSCRYKIIGYDETPALFGYNFCPHCGAKMSYETEYN